MSARQATAINRRTFVHGVAAFGAFGAFGACGAAMADDDTLIAAAKREGRGTLYSVIDPTLNKGVLDAFADKYGIAIDVQRATASVLAQRFSSEIEAGSNAADVLITTDKVFPETAAGKNWLVPLDGLPAFSALPARSRTATSAVIGHVPYSIVWNTTQIAEPPKGWEQLADSKLKGRLLLIDPRTAVNPQQWFLLMRKTYGDAFIRELGKLCTFTSSVVPGLQQVAAGAAAVYAPAVHQVTVGLLAKGAPLGELFPSPTTSSDNVMVLSARAPHPNVGRLLANFYLTPEAQAILNKDGFSPLPNIPGTRSVPEMVELDPKEAQAELPKLVALIGLG